MQRKGSARALKYGTFSIILAIVVILSAVGINLLVSLLPTSVLRTDLTKLKLSELSEQSIDYLETLSDKVTIYHICITGEEDDTVLDMLAKYEEASDNLKIQSIDPAVHPSFVGKYTDKSLENNSLIVVSSKRSKAIDYYNMFTFKLFYTDQSGNTTSQGEMSHGDFQTFYQYYADYFGTYYSYDTLFAGESVITSAIDYVTTENLPAAYYVTGHGEIEMSDNLKSSIYLDNIDLKQLSIMASGIPEDADCLIINSPVSDFAESESNALRAYLEHGGNIILITDPTHLDLPNLFSVTKEYGLTASKGYICESTSFMGQSYMVIPNASVASQTLSISGYSSVMPYSHPVVINKEEGKEGTVYLQMFKSSDKAYLVDEIENGENEGTEEIQKQQYDMGVLAVTDNEGKSSRILWIGCSSYLNDEINNYSTGGNYLYFISILENMTEKTSSLSIISKKLVEDSLVVNFAQVCFWSCVFCVIIPLSVIIGGSVYYVKRRNR